MNLKVWLVSCDDGFGCFSNNLAQKQQQSLQRLENPVFVGDFVCECTLWVVIEFCLGEKIIFRAVNFPFFITAYMAIVRVLVQVLGDVWTYLDSKQARCWIWLLNKLCFWCFVNLYFLVSKVHCGEHFAVRFTDSPYLDPSQAISCVWVPKLIYWPLFKEPQVRRRLVPLRLIRKRICGSAYRSARGRWRWRAPPSSSSGSGWPSAVTSSRRSSVTFFPPHRPPKNAHTMLKKNAHTF